VTLSNFLSGLLTDAIVLHCDERYQPCGWTAPLARTVDLKTFQNQTAKPKRLNEKLWHEMLRGKTLNQSRVLQHKQLRSPHLRLMPRPIRWRGRMRKIPCRRSGCRNCRCWRQIK
jgi:CRISPR/Cas system-associated endonuclease Cas1